MKSGVVRSCRRRLLRRSGANRVGVGLGGDQRVTNRYHEHAHGGNLRRMPRRRTARLPATDVVMGGSIMIDPEPQTAAGKVLWHFLMSLDGFVAGPGHTMDS
jgi:hypothetical protein